MCPEDLNLPVVDKDSPITDISTTNEPLNKEESVHKDDGNSSSKSTDYGNESTEGQQVKNELEDKTQGDTCGKGHSKEFN